jgi:hypothetical protein
MFTVLMLIKVIMSSNKISLVPGDFAVITGSPKGIYKHVLGKKVKIIEVYTAFCSVVLLETNEKMNIGKQSLKLTSSAAAGKILSLATIETSLLEIEAKLEELQAKKEDLIYQQQFLLKHDLTEISEKVLAIYRTLELTESLENYAPLNRAQLLAKVL